ncbi:MAG: glycosyltransferase [Candidatus Thermoplasmatota archaeon]|nr:glycosyltransferase [Candidatus Thermoplasmatota archaeon]
MKILLATESYYPNIDGGAIAQYNLVQSLKKRGHEVSIIAPGFSLRKTIENNNGTTIYRTRAVKLLYYMKSRYYFSPFPLFEVRKVIKKVKPDIINICSPYPISISAMLWARKYDIPVIGAIHVLPQNMLAPFFNFKIYETIKEYTWRYLIYFFNLVDWATIPTKTGADMFIKRGLKTNITPISNGLETKIFNPDNNVEYLRKRYGLPDKNIILFTGRINEEKNLDVLINAIPYVLEKINAHFLLVGSGGEYKNKLMNLTKELNVTDHTTFTDFLDWKDYPNIYDIADVFAIPSESELQSIVTMEAIASGLPVVVVNNGALPELANMNNGFVFEPKNSKQMAECIVKILSNEKLKNTMSENSLKLIKQHSMDSVTYEFEKTFEKVINMYNK